MRVMGRFAELAALDRSSAAMVLAFMADTTGTSAVEAAVVAIRTMELADAEPPNAAAVMNQITREFARGDLRFPVSGKSICSSCHPAQARRLVLAALESLRPTTYADLCAAWRWENGSSARHHLVTVPPPG